ncbi:MAG: sigma-70 family RNA polymerase sigma factor [Bacteroidota bacterium]|nr:sigma-70 family RNA polymerase sigma factor [Bacteroidota bacterium]
MPEEKSVAEKEMVEACIRNDRMGQERLYRQYFHSMHRMCSYYIQNEDRSLEILNMGFLRVFQKLSAFRFEGSLEGWIRKVIYHYMMTELALDQKYKKTIALSIEDERIVGAPMEELFEEDLIMLIDKLPPATAKVFMLFAKDGYSHQEISTLLNISVGTSKWHISSAREKLKILIDKDYVR